MFGKRKKTKNKTLQTPKKASEKKPFRNRNSKNYSIRKTFRSVFTFLGLLIVFVGFFIGSILGYILCLIQQSSSFLKLETPNGVIAYPVQIDVYDFSIIMSLILSIGFIISIIVTRIVFSPKKN